MPRALLERPERNTGTPAASSACQCSATGPVPLSCAASASSGRACCTPSPARETETSCPASAALRATRRPSAALVGFSGPVATLTSSRTPLLLLGHSEDVIARELPHQI